jgi:drug/metabolite transporter (DMT)-like permease
MKKWIPIIALLICCMIWGTTFVAIKHISTKIDPYLLSTLRSLIAIVILFPFIIFSKNRISLFNKTAAKYGFITGLILGAIYIVQTIGMQFTSSNHSAFISSSAVIMIPLLLVLSKKQTLNLQQIFAIIIIACGLFFLTNSNDDLPFNNGDTITFFAAFICALHILLSGRYVRKTDFLGMVFYQFLFAAIVSIIGLFINSQLIGTKIVFDKMVVNSVLYLGLFGTLVCFFVTIWAQKYISTLTTAMIFSLEPIFAAITSFIILNEQLSKIEIIGAFGIIVGLVYFNLLKNQVEL